MMQDGLIQNVEAEDARKPESEESVTEFYAHLASIFAESRAVAYRYFGERHTYRDLHAMMCGLNSVLSDYDQEQIVVYGTKEVATYAAIFALFLTNNVWVPLSTEVPDARNLGILAEVDPRLVLHSGELPEAIAGHCRQHDIQTLSYHDVLATGEATPFGPRTYAKDDVAYIMFTSGSTGTPKGVPMTHENYINFVRNILDILPFGKDEVFSDFHDFAFDLTIFSLFACVLTEGAFSPIMDEKDKVVPVNHIVENGVTVWSSVPSVINRIRMFRPKDTVETPIRIMFLCGEPFKLDVLRYCLENMSLDRVYNFYGLTETGVENFWHRCGRKDLETFAERGAAPIGRPMPGNVARLSEERELWIGGCQVTPGYLGGRSPENFEELDGVRWFKTGDIAEEGEGVYFCKGRIDSQVKLSGHRVELMDIEATIVQQNNVDQAVCFVWENAGQSVLVAALRTIGVFDFSTLQNELGSRLPRYMVPRDHMILERFPVNANGKEDRKRIRELYGLRQAR